MKHYLKIKKRSLLKNSISLVMTLIIITSIISLISLILFAINKKYISYLAINPSNIFQGKYLWTILTHIFVHGSIAHLLINMIVLYSLGTLCEKIIGKKRFLWFYLLAGIVAGILSITFSYYFGNSPLGAKLFGAPNVFMLGSSGAIFAIAGLYVMLLPRLRFMIIFLPFFSLPAYIMVPLVLFLTWIVSVLTGLPIGNVAHLGGFLSGLIYGMFLRIKYKKKIAKLQRYFR